MSETFRFTPPPKPVERPPEEPDEEPAYNPRARLDYLAAVNPRKKKRTWLRVLVSLILLALLAGAAVFAYPHLIKKQRATPAATKQTTSQQKQSSSAAPDKVSTKHFDSSNFNLGFDYPENWTVDDNAQTARLTVTSPATSQKTSSGSTALVRTVMTIAAKGQNLTAFDKGSGLAARNSEKIKYTSPTSAQRAETYLAFVQYSTTPSGDGLDGIYITGDYGYQKGQAIPKTDMVNLDPLVAVTFQQCSDSSCSATPTAVSLPSSAWDTTSFSTPISTMLKSLSIN